ncbi:MAG: insulinase family protein, partial [Clostridia bacterium]|nr:insulinase family protein [Clostridia bacterium]
MILTDRLKNGMQVVAEPMEGVRSVSMGVWIAAGPVYEARNEAGISHMIEHMLFKGTQRRPASQIAAEMDGLGGNLNAFTAKECTCFYAKVLDEHLPKALDILQDLVRYSRIDPQDLAREQGVVCEEILMMEDSPEELVHELLGETIYGDTPLSRQILGTQESVRAFLRENLGAYMQRRYRPAHMVLSCAGHFEMPALMDLLNETFGSDGEVAGANGVPGADMPSSALMERRTFKGAEKDVEQAHICLGFPGFATDTPEQFALLVLNNALGGSMSSRLFQHIREERGLAYSVYSYPTGYSGTGYFALYAGTGEKQSEEVVRLMLDEVRSVREKGITKEEFCRAKEQLKGSYMLGQESTSARSGAIGRSMLLLGTAREEEDVLS